MSGVRVYFITRSMFSSSDVIFYSNLNVICKLLRHVKQPLIRPQQGPFAIRIRIQLNEANTYSVHGELVTNIVRFECCGFLNQSFYRLSNLTILESNKMRHERRLRACVIFAKICTAYEMTLKNCAKQCDCCFVTPVLLHYLNTHRVHRTIMANSGIQNAFTFILGWVTQI